MKTFIKTNYGYLNLDTVICFSRNAFNSKSMWHIYLPTSSGFMTTAPVDLWITDKESLEIIDNYLVLKGVPI